MLEGVEDDALYNELALVANNLAALLPRVRAVCAGAQKQLPSSGQDIPGGLIAVHRALVPFRQFTGRRRRSRSHVPAGR